MTDKGQQLMHGQMYVEKVAPARVTKPWPLVLIHGAAQTATNWMGTPDGRTGWADHFASLGYAVYMVDQPMRGRSAWHPADGATRMFSVSAIESQFTAIETLGTWPQAKKHTQWPGEGPGKGRRGDPVFDAFYATQVESLASNADTHAAVQAATTQLLDRIGPAVIVTHSQAGPFGWLIADARPALVKAIVAIEPSGPPFENQINATGKARDWGLTDVPIAYDPPIAAATELKTERHASEGPGLTDCVLQQAPARRLVNLARVPVALVVSEASYHAPYDHCTAAYLAQAGVKVDLMRLEQHGIFGNGHMMMIEKNSLVIADLIAGWVDKAAR